MRNLIAFGQSGQFVNFASSLAEFNIVHGCLVEYHPGWLVAWRVRQSLGERATDFMWRHLPIGVGYFDQGPWISNDGSPQDFDPKWRPPGPIWAYLVRLTGMSPNTDSESLSIPPYLVKILVEPPNLAADDAARALHRARRQQVMNQAQAAPFMVSVEDRPRATFQSATTRTKPALKGGFEIPLTPRGTVGGILQNRADGEKYLITCAHVTAGQSVTVRTPSGPVALGHPTHEVALQVNPAPVCNSMHPNCVANTVDISAINVTNHNFTNEIDGVGLVKDIRSVLALSATQTVESHGAGSGRVRSWSIQGTTVWRDFSYNGSNYCYRDLFHYNHQAVAPLAAPITRALSYVPQAGDSGAWLCAHMSSPQVAFCGMHVGSDGVNGYAITTDAIQTWAKTINLEFEQF